MKRTTIYSLFAIFTLIILIGSISNVHAYNFESGVEVGDEIVYEYESNLLDLEQITHVKVVIDEIKDSGDNATIISATLFGSNNGGESYDAATQDIPDIATLMNYSLDPAHPIIEGDFFVVPGTKIGLYVSEINAAIPSGTASSINNDYGIEIVDSPDANKTLIYDENGICIKSHRADPDTRFFDIYSINGRRYNTIPGYSVFLVIGFIVLGIVGIFFVQLRKKPKK
jgi:hypothetical protein